LLIYTQANATRSSKVDGAGFEPAASTMPTWRSYQADLPAQRELLLKLNP
jgi:hypothetical protein